MRIAIVSDVHGNRRAFDAVRADLKEVSPDLVLHGGDLAANGAHPEYIVDQIRSLGWRGVLGNTDEMLCCPERLEEVARTHPKLAKIVAAFQEMVPFTRDRLGEERLSWLAGLPPLYTGTLLTLVHATLDDLWRAPLPSASDEEMQAAYGMLPTEMVFYGHIHRPHVRQVQNLTVANTGSLSLSYDGDPRASYLVINGENITIRRVEYDIEQEANDLLNSGLPHAEWLCRILTAGKYSPPE
jgi:predicted phosphodiesterase